MEIFSVFEDGLSKPAVTTMVDCSISTSDLPSYISDGLFDIVLAKKLYRMMMTFETTMMLANVARAGVNSKKNWN